MCWGLGGLERLAVRRFTSCPVVDWLATFDRNVDCPQQLPCWLLQGCGSGLEMEAFQCLQVDGDTFNWIAEVAITGLLASPVSDFLVLKLWITEPFVAELDFFFISTQISDNNERDWWKLCKICASGQGEILVDLIQCKRVSIPGIHCMQAHHQNTGLCYILLSQRCWSSMSASVAKQHTYPCSPRPMCGTFIESLLGIQR